MKKKAKTHYVPVDGTAVNPKWTPENAKYILRRARQKIANENGERIAQERKQSGREPVNVPATF